MIKKILYFLLTVTLAVSISSYTTPNNYGGIKKKVLAQDSVNVNISVRSQQPKIDAETYRDLKKLMQSTIDLNTSKQKVIDKLSNMEPEEAIPLVEQLCYERGYTKEALFKKARADTNIKFWTSILILLISITTITLFIRYSMKRLLDWQSTLIFSVLILGGLFIVQMYFQYIVAYLFNSEYLTMKELINFF